jgi:hypothetical protein
MPLQLNTPESELPKRIVWDPASVDDVREAEERVQKLRAAGWRLALQEVGEALLEPPELAETDCVMRILDDNGDTRLVWNRADEKEVQEARKKFNEYKAKGYRAYVCRSDGRRGALVESFDALFEEIIVGEKGPPLPRPSRRAEGVMIPPTHPG